MIVPVIQARLGSTRFPGKVMAPFRQHGYTLLDWTVLCARRAFTGTTLVLAVPAGDPRLAHIGMLLGCRVVEGPEEDVLGRFMCVVTALDLKDDDIIVRLTPDDPCKVPLLVWLAARLVELGAPYADTNHGPLTGFGAEAFRVALLREADRLDPPDWREHVTRGMRATNGSTSVEATVDTPEDLARLETLMEGAPR
jgi:spore coat polysaccharide biosynthesis protein SpsF